MSREHHELAAAARIPVARIRMHPRNIRSSITGLDELAASIRYEGVLVPLLVHKKFRRQTGVQDLELIAGHRRLAAAEIAGKAVRALRSEFGYGEAAIAERLGVSVAEIRAWGRGRAAHPVPAVAVQPTLGQPVRRRPVSKAPRIPAARVHQLLAEHDAGRLDAGDVIARMRGMLGGWEPDVRPVERAAS